MIVQASLVITNKLLFWSDEGNKLRLRRWGSSIMLWAPSTLSEFFGARVQGGRVSECLYHNSFSCNFLKSFNPKNWRPKKRVEPQKCCSRRKNSLHNNWTVRMKHVCTKKKHKKSTPPWDRGVPPKCFLSQIWQFWDLKLCRKFLNHSINTSGKKVCGREKQKKKLIIYIVDTLFCSHADGQHTYSTQTKIILSNWFEYLPNLICQEYSRQTLCSIFFFPPLSWCQGKGQNRLLHSNTWNHHSANPLPL